MGFCFEGICDLPYVDTYVPDLRPKSKAAKVNKTRHSRQGGHLSGITYVGQHLRVSDKHRVSAGMREVAGRGVKDILEVTVNANMQFKGKKVLNRGRSKDSSRYVGEWGWVG